MIESLMRMLTSLFPLRNIELSDLNLRNPWMSTRAQRKLSNDNMGIQNLKIPRGRSWGKQELPSIADICGRTGADIEIEINSARTIHPEQTEQAK